MVLRCRDTGGWCNWEGRADIPEELVEMALRHAEKAHHLKRTPEFREEARTLIRDEQAQSPPPSLDANIAPVAWWPKRPGNH